ncbi:uncharacterized protein LOC112679449 [Sipha flava]|uniref:Uncharacterized protein LOC112679449 n=1 Tax=Sipha flava TaxID=143950 RepID=A0A8B8F401_9HEMI|nr:uncharacterized protein LOC112679449 [Sipha flava]
MGVNDERLPPELAKLINKRDSAKRSMDSIKTFIDKYDPATKSLNQLQTRLDSLMQYRSKYESCQDDIENHTAVTVEMLDHRTGVDDFFCSLKAEILDIIERYSKVPFNTSSTPSQPIIRDSMKLPFIPAPTFDGDLQKWVSFLDAFNAMFHYNQGLSDVQCLHYLKSCLVGPAAEVIRTIPTTDVNYSTAYNALIERYENRSLIIQSHIRSLFQTPQVHKPAANELRQLHHHVVSQVNALKALDQPVEQWDAWLVTLLCCRLDPTTVGEWQLLQSTKNLPKFSDLERFLSNRVSAYEVGEAGNQSTQYKHLSIGTRPVQKRVLFTKQTDSPPFKDRKCLVCSQQHRVSSCDVFNKMSLPERQDIVFKNKLCYNCLFPGHQVRQCRGDNCNKCGKRHNTKLHNDAPLNYHNPVDKPSSSSPEQSIVAYVEQDNKSNVIKQIILATALVNLENAVGQRVQCRAILDSGSQVCLITRECTSRLKLNVVNSSISIAGIGSITTKTGTMISTTMCSRINGFKAFINFHVINSITNRLPSHCINIEPLNIPHTISDCLADPHFNEPASVDLLLGAEVFFELFTGEKMKVSPLVTLHNTNLGWIFAGSIPINTMLSPPNSLFSSNCNQSAIALFTQTYSNKFSSEIKAEDHFKCNVSRDNLGRFVVKLPFLQDPSVLGDSRFMAQQRFYNLERKLSKNPTLAADYKTFMNEYLELGHMELAHKTDGPTYYLPHHSVFKSNSLTTKMRVVFDGSAATKSGHSLNDILLCGPTVQPELISIILRFRMHKVALTADIAKMYRQIRVSPEDCDMQRICYRESPADPLKDYRLLTVTYGTRAASFLATRCLLELSYSVTNHATQRAIQQDFYVDDLLSGGQDEAECYELFQNLSNELNKANLPLRKWCSNSKLIMSKMSIPESDPTYLLSINEEDTVSTLGLTWQPSNDCFKFVFKDLSRPLHMTKRTLLSNINSVYDPVGFLTPALIRGKIFMQHLWSSKLNWDTPLSPDLQTKWTNFYQSLQSLEQLSIPRRVPFDNVTSVQLHGFCDASQNAFGACVYFRSLITSQCHLYCSKSRVAPLKPATIPRLELCGALLLAELITMVTRELERIKIYCDPANLILWSDSSIVISWINTDKPLKSYVSNRVAQILELSQPSQWRHVPTTSNPADVISRGCSAESLLSNELWWNGPKWLAHSEDLWPSNNATLTDLPEVKIIRPVLLAIQPVEYQFEEKYSSWSRMNCIAAYILRFCHNARTKIIPDRRLNSLSVIELTNAAMVLIRKAQSTSFASEIVELKAGRPVGRRSALRALNPFIDEDCLLRVGGRLINADIAYTSKCPIVLPAKCTVTRLIFEYEHKRLIHIGPRGLLANIHLRYWPIRGRIIANQTVRRCIVCFRSSPSLIAPFMAPLPRERVNIERPFAKTGVDFCGPILIRSGIRKVVSIKCYIAVFVCFVTRAVHLELVSGLTTEAFLASLMRFLSRRGYCSHMYSDNGTNFVGANKVLHSYFQRVEGQRTIEESLSDLKIQWHFIPPSAPHFGGLWEAAVKSAKKHLLKINTMGLLTFEEMNTLLCRIEAVLNSRPISPMSDDPSDLNALTPGHFLVGGSLTLPAEPDSTGIPLNRVKRWGLVNVQAQIFWKRWSAEYLPQLHKRGCWLSKKDNVKIGSLAILKEDNIPSMKWKMVRIIKVHPGADGVVRVVTVVNSVGREFQRPTSKIAVLPSIEEEDTD